MNIEEIVHKYIEIESNGGGVYHPDGNHIIFVSNRTGHMQLFEFDLKTQESTQLVETSNRQTNPRVLSDGSVIFSEDDGGDENFQLFVLKDGKVTKLSEHNTAKYRYAFSTDNYVYYSANDVDSKRFDVYRIPIPLEKENVEKVVEGFEYLPLTPRCVDEEEKVLVLTRSTGNLWTDMYVLEDNELKHLTDKYERVFFSPIALIDNKTILLTTDHNRQFQSLALFDIETDDIIFLEGDDWNTEEVKYHRESGWVYYTKNVDGSSEMWRAKISGGELVDKKKVKLPDDNGIIESRDLRTFTSGFHLNPTGDKLLISYSTPTSPMNIWEIIPDEERCVQITESSTDDLEFTGCTLHRYTSFDTLVIPYFFYEGRGEGKRPTIIQIHGGPEGMYRPGFKSDVQIFTAMGYNVVAPNIRGSHGYGRLYLSLDDVEKRLDSIADIKSLADHIRSDERVDGERLIIYGGSYGGFAVLSSITEYPDTFACAVDIVGISDFETFLKKTAPWRRKLREVEYGFLDKDIETLREISPIHKVDKIVTPTLIIQGDNDERVPLEESIQIFEKLQKRNIKSKLLRFADEGHGVTKKKNQIVMFTEVLEFLKAC